MKIVFLDMDGVVNSHEWFAKMEERGENMQRIYTDMIDPDAVARLEQIRTATDCYFVLSSSWRIAHHHKAVEEMLRGKGFGGTIVDSTPKYLADSVRQRMGDVKHANHRGHEIQAWLDSTAAQVDAFVILDDDSDMVHLAPRLVRTDWGRGLLDKHVVAAIEMLNAPTTLAHVAGRAAVAE